MKVVRFSVIHRPGATAATSAGPLSAAVICAVVIVRQRGPPGTSNHWNEGGRGKGGGLWSTTKGHKRISAQITTPT